MDRPAVRDAALLLLRICLGVVFVAHGVDKMFLTGITDTARQFGEWGVPQPQLSAYLAAIGEMLGGAMLAVGLLTTFIAGLLALLAVMALYFVHLSQGFFVAQGGVEYTMILVVALLMIVVFGAGRASLDEVLARVEP